MAFLPGESVVRVVGAPRLVPVRASVEVWRFRPLAVLRIAIGLLLVAQLGRIPFLDTGTGEAPLLVNDLCVLAVLSTGLLGGLASRSFRVDHVASVALLFAAIGACSAVLAIPRFGLTSWELVISLAYLARWLVYFGLYLVVINVVRVEDVTGLWRALEVTILLFAVLGLLQAVFLPHFAQLVYPDSRVAIDWDEQGHRLVSTVLDPNIAGAMIMIVLLVQVALLSGGGRSPLWKPLLLFAALVATLSRSSFLGLLVGGAIILAVRGVSRRIIRIAAVILVLSLAALPQIVRFAQGYNKLGIDESALTRVASWLRALTVFADNPVIGVGFNTYGFVQERYGYVRLGASSFSTDGGLLFVAVMTGVVGLSLYVGMLVLIVRRCRAVWRSGLATAEHRALATGIAAATVGVTVHSIFVNSLLTTFVMEQLWVLWGIAFVIARSLPTPDAPPLPTRLVACGAAA